MLIDNSLLYFSVHSVSISTTESTTYCYCINVIAFMFLIPSSQYSELLMASYNANEHAPQEPDGVVLVWNMKFKKTAPEYIFHCQVKIFVCWP